MTNESDSEAPDGCVADERAARQPSISGTSVDDSGGAVDADDVQEIDVSFE